MSVYTPTYTRPVKGAFNADKNFIAVRAGSDAFLLEDELNEMQWLQSNAKAEVVRQMAHSGVLSLGAITYGSSTLLNAIKVAKFNAVINGHVIVIDQNEGEAAGSNKITMPNPPGFADTNLAIPGKRDDFVFLEAWLEEIIPGTTVAANKVYKYGGETSGVMPVDDRVDAAGNLRTDGRINAETSRYVQLRWRIRTVAGVDFSLYPEGLHSGNTAITGMGGSLTQVAGKTFQQYNAGARQFAFTDVGLYIAGNGSTEDKNALKTVDGYTFAIPLFMAKRRNDSGYSALNPHGAINHVTYGYNTVTITMIKGLTYDMTLSTTAGLEVGKEYYITGTSVHWVKIVSIVNETVARVVYNSTGTAIETIFGISSTNNVFRSKSDRNDDKYANIISDIIDLRHKVPFSINNESIMEENFFSLLRSELLTKEPKKMVRIVHGLPKTTIDANHMFYASLDGTTVAEVGGALTLGTGNFSSMPTGLGYKFGGASQTSVSISGLSASEGTIDAWVNLNDFVQGTENRGIVGLIDSSNIRFAAVYISSVGALTLITCNPDGTNFVTTAFTGITTNYKNFIHIRGTWSTSAGKVSLFVNGILVKETSGYSSVGLSTPTKVIVGAYASPPPTTIGYKYTGSIADVSVSNIDRGTNFATLPYDFTVGEAVIMQSFNTQRLIQSDALTVQFSRAFADPVNGPASDRCITVTKGAGKTNNAIWEATDTIEVRGLCGEIVSGVVDTDTIVTTIIESITTLSYPQVIKVSSVTGIAVDDQLKAIKTDLSQSRTLVVSAVDATANTITVTDGGGTLTFLNTTTTPYLYEITASSSSPTVKYSHEGVLGDVPGTWATLGTNKAVFTIGDLTAVANFLDHNVQLEYSLIIPPGNGGVPEVLSETLGGTVKNRKLIPGTIAVRDDFVAKVGGSTVACPNAIQSKAITYSTFSATDRPQDFTDELTTLHYGNLIGLDGFMYTYSIGGSEDTGNAGKSAAIMVTVDLIREFEDKYGTIKALNKVQWVKDNIGNIVCNVWGFGSSVGGNKISLHRWGVSNLNWGIVNGNHTNSVVTKFNSNSASDYVPYISPTGTCYFLIFAEPSDATTPSIINIDYINVDFGLKVATGYDMLVPENPRRDDGLAGVLQVRKETKEIQSYFPLTDTDQVATWGNYIPIQSLSTNATGKILAVSKFLYVTTSGTGGINTSVAEVFKALLKNFKLPSAWPIYMFDGSSVKLTPIVTPSGSDTSFKFVPIVSNYTNSLNRMTGAEGTTVPTFYGEDLSKVQNKVVLYPVLVVINSKLILRVAIISTSSVNISSTGSDSTQTYMDFDVSGRILIK